MTPERFATIDIGTNSVLLLVAERRAGGFTALCERAEITRLGRGVDATRRLSPESMASTLEVVERYAQEARGLGAQAIACVATSAARDAENGAEFFQALDRRAGITAEVIPGHEEARLSYLAAEADFGPGAKVVLDIGGGSTELILGGRGAISFSCSYDVGSVRLTERHVRADPASAEERAAVTREISRILGAAPRPPPAATLVGIAGTVTTLFAVSRRIDPYDASQIHGGVMTREEVSKTCEMLWALSTDARSRLPGLQPKRADVIPSGASILLGAMEALSATQVTVSDHGVRWGLLASRFGPPR